MANIGITSVILVARIGPTQTILKLAGHQVVHARLGRAHGDVPGQHLCATLRPVGRGETAGRQRCGGQQDQQGASIT